MWKGATFRKNQWTSFVLALADASGQQLAKKLQKFGPALMEESGLVGKRDDGSFYDYFRARLMFPIHNEAGKVIGFGGRALRPDEKAKYLNSPTQAVYITSRRCSTICIARRSRHARTAA